MDGKIKSRIGELLASVREWQPGDARPDVSALARRYRLDPLIVRRLLESEGIQLDPSELDSVARSHVDPDDATLVMRIDAIDLDERRPGSFD